MRSRLGYLVRVSPCRCWENQRNQSAKEATERKTKSHAKLELLASENQSSPDQPRRSGSSHDPMYPSKILARGFQRKTSCLIVDLQRSRRI